MPTELNPTHDRFVEHLGLLWEGQGLPRIAGRMVGLLTLQDAPMSLDEIAASLSVSKGSVSHDARRLQSLGLLVRVPASPGDRRDYYAVAPDLPLAMLEHRAKELTGLATALEAAIALPDTPSAVRKRLQQFSKFHRAVVASLQQIANSITP